MLLNKVPAESAKTTSTATVKREAFQKERISTSDTGEHGNLHREESWNKV